MATEAELADFLKSVEQRAYKRALYHVRDAESALDIVQEAMMRLAERYGDRPPAELPLLFQRILSNCMLDWFRRQKTRSAVLVSMHEFETDSDDDDEFDLLDVFSGSDAQAETTTQRSETLRIIEEHIQALPARQREAFLLRYWEEMDVTETAAIMGCSEGSVKTHCSRATKALAKALRAKGITP